MMSQQVPLWRNSFPHVRHHLHANREKLMSRDLLEIVKNIWGEDACVESENIIKMFPVRVINACAPATLRLLQKHHLAVAGFVRSVAFDLDAVKVACTADVLRRRPELQTSHTNRYFHACEYLRCKS